MHRRDTALDQCQVPVLLEPLVKFLEPIVYLLSSKSGTYTRIYLLIIVLWTLATSVIAVRQALDYQSTGRAVAVCALALLLALTMAFLLGLFWGPVLSGL